MTETERNQELSNICTKHCPKDYCLSCSNGDPCRQSMGWAIFEDSIKAGEVRPPEREENTQKKLFLQ